MGGLDNTTPTKYTPGHTSLFKSMKRDDFSALLTHLAKLLICYEIIHKLYIYTTYIDLYIQL